MLLKMLTAPPSPTRASTRFGIAAPGTGLRLDENGRASPFGIDGHEGRRRRVDRRQVHRHRHRVGGDAERAGQCERPRLTLRQRPAASTRAIAGVEHSLRCHRDEPAGRRRRQHDHRSAATAGRAGAAVEEPEVLEGAVQDRAAAAAHPAIEHGADDRPEVDVVVEPVPLLEARQRRLHAVQPALDARADDEQIVRRAVVGAARLVRERRAPELRHRHDRDAIAERRRDGVVERLDRTRRDRPAGRGASCSDRRACRTRRGRHR